MKENNHHVSQNTHRHTYIQYYSIHTMFKMYKTKYFLDMQTQMVNYLYKKKIIKKIHGEI